MICFRISSQWTLMLYCCLSLYFMCSCDKSQGDKALTSDNAHKDSLLALNADLPVPGRSQRRVTTVVRKVAASNPKAEEIVEYAATLLGIPYKVAGKDEEGFDCSGFVSYVFKQYGIGLPSSTKALIEKGERIDLAEAAPGDIIFFTGTDSSSREVGHAGIIVSRTADSTRFIHSSSARSSACVKYNVLEASRGYQRRFMMVRRVLNHH
jgi:cell wall-associated NlpC family hydrolase